MTLAVVYRAPAMSAEQYKDSWAGSNDAPVPVPRGLLFHAGVGEGDEFFTISVWESDEAYADFAPMFKQAMSEKGFNFGSPAMLPVHHWIEPTSSA
ncbi:MAG TPA: hypothetical protein VNE62_08470 [Actinomycetota bacterium]|nr:hypothetical protein [Actinomycetota bacterium]